jgi:hypothetical protein
MPLPRTPVPAAQPPKSLSTSARGGRKSEAGITRPGTPASDQDFSDNKAFVKATTHLGATEGGTDSGGSNTGKESHTEQAAAQHLLSASTSPPASALDEEEGGERSKEPGPLQPGPEEASTLSSPSQMTPGQRSPGVARSLSQGGGGGKAKQRKESDIQTKQKRPHPVQGFDLDSSSSDIDLVPDMLYIPDPEYNREMLIQARSLLLPGAIQAVSQRLASTINDKTYPFPTISRYFIAKARDLKVIGADLLRHRQLIQQGDPPVFYMMTILNFCLSFSPSLKQLKPSTDLTNPKLNLNLVTKTCS